MPRLADIKSCTGCLACVDVCARGALVSTYNSEGHISFDVVTNKCVECGLCEKVCPVVSDFHYGTNSLKDSKPFAAWCKDSELRAKSTSGGVFAALAKYVISNGGIVIGASMRHNLIRHVAIEKIEDLYLLQGSKYAQSDTNGIYKTTKKLLQSGQTVLFSGLGCQVAALLSYLGDRKYSGELFTLDLICGGVPSRFIIDYFLRENTEVDEIVAFRNKSKYEFSVKLRDGKIKVIPLSERPFPLCGFYTELTNRYSCYDCKFNGAHRLSDITIGDYWGDAQFVEQHKKGLSIAVAHSKRGESLMKHAGIELHETEWDNFLMHNPRMIDGYKNKSNSKVRLYLAEAFKSYSYEKLLQTYANKATWKQPLSMVRKVYRYIRGSIEGKFYLTRLSKEIEKLKNQ